MQPLKPLLGLIGLVHELGGVGQVVEDALIEQGPHGGDGAVDFIEGEPVFHLALVPGKDGPAVVEKIVNHLTADPGVAFFGQAKRHLVVADGDKRLDAVPEAFVDDLIVMAQACFIGLSLVAIREDAGPCDGEAIALEAHFGKKGNVLFESVVVLDGLMTGVEGTFLQHGGNPFALAEPAAGADVGHRDAFSVVVPGTLALVGRCGTAPQKIFAQYAHTFLSFAAGECIRL